MRNQDRWLHTWSTALALLMAAQAALGLLFAGAYRDAAWVRASWFGSDVVTLAVVVPLILGAVALDRRESARGRLLLVGALGYAIYNYAYYLLGAALNVYFPLYAAALLLAVVLLVAMLRRTDARALAPRQHERGSARLVGGYLLVVAVGLEGSWLTAWARSVFADHATTVDPEAFKLVAALDTMLMVPALALGGALLWRRRSWGWVVGTLGAVQCALYLLALAVGSATAVARGLAPAPGEMQVWGSLAALTVVGALALLREVRTLERGSVAATPIRRTAAIVHGPVSVVPVTAPRALLP